MKTELSQSAQVHYTLSVINADGTLARRLPRKRNLILDQGLDGLASRSWAEAFRYAALGTGTTPTKRDSGAVTVSRTGSTLTASAGYFEAGDVGRLFKFDTGEEVRITAYASGTSVTTATSGTIAAAEGTMWYVNQTALITETKRTGTCSPAGGANGTTYSAPVVTHKRTFDFPAETGTVTYREIGWSHSASAGANLFGRALLAGAGVTLVATQQLRVVVELAVSYGPTTPQPYVSAVTGWAQPGMSGYDEVLPYVVFIDSIGNVAPTIKGEALEPYYAGSVILSTSSGTHPGNSISGMIDSARSYPESYVPGSFSIVKTASFGTGLGNSTAIRSITLLGSNPGYSPGAFRVLLDAPETKTSLQSLTVQFTLSWGRVLDNS